MIASPSTASTLPSAGLLVTSQPHQTMKISAAVSRPVEVGSRGTTTLPSLRLITAFHTFNQAIPPFQYQQLPMSVQPHPSMARIPQPILAGHEDTFRSPHAASVPGSSLKRPLSALLSKSQSEDDRGWSKPRLPDPPRANNIHPPPMRDGTEFGAIRTDNDHLTSDDENHSSADSNSHSQDHSDDPLTRRRLAPEERLRRSRERNRVHAQKTRVRKRQFQENLQTKISALLEEQGDLKRQYDHHYGAACLLGLSAQASPIELDPVDEIVKSLETENDRKISHVSEDEESQDEKDQDEEEANEARDGKRRRNLELTKEERDRIRRERNRIHAKRARLRRKQLLERTQKTVTILESQNGVLRDRLAHVMKITVANQQ